MKLVSADYSQIELRVLAHVADIPQLKKAFAEGLDIHAMTASEMFGVPVKDMPSEVRRRAKAINFGIIYGISAFGLANQLSISREEAGDYIKTYFQRFPGIRDYMDATKKAAHAHGFVETIFGRRMHYPEINTKNPSMRGFLERAAINAPIQGSAADIIRRAMIRMPAALERAKLASARMLLQVHDELVFEVADAEATSLIKVARQVMETAAEPALKLSVPIHVDAKAAANWHPTKRKTSCTRATAIEFSPSPCTHNSCHPGRDVPRSALSTSSRERESNSVRFVPIRGGFGVHVDRNREFECGLGGGFHNLTCDFDQRSCVGVRHLEHELVVHLQQHARRRELGPLERLRHADHRAPDDVGRRALDRRVDRGALEEAAHRRVLGVDLRVMHAPPENRLDVAVRVRVPSSSRPCSRECRENAGSRS